MQIESEAKNGWRLVRVMQDVHPEDKLHELRQHICPEEDSGPLNVAVVLTPASYLGSEAIGVLVKCFEKVRGKGGDFAVVGAGKEISEVFQIIGLKKLVKLYDSEDEIPARPAPPPEAPPPSG
jgi:stage II sporulation protein AA (anti-sigma F factor antagonist)